MMLRASMLNTFSLRRRRGVKRALPWRTMLLIMARRTGVSAPDGPPPHASYLKLASPVCLWEKAVILHPCLLNTPLNEKMRTWLRARVLINEAPLHQPANCRPCWRTAFSANISDLDVFERGEVRTELLANWSSEITGTGWGFWRRSRPC